MRITIILSILTAVLFYSTQALNCTDNPCALGGYYSPAKGYTCVQLNNDTLCTCPNGGYEINQPCRICNRSNPSNNPCLPTVNFLRCLETDDFGTNFACLCSSPSGPAITTAADCNLAVTLTSTATTTSNPIVTVTPSICSNGGNLVDGVCNCPSGFGGTYCQQKYDVQLCDRIICKNNGVCSIRDTNGPTESVCLCYYGTSGDYCQLNGTLGFCSAGLCMNGGACEEVVIGITRFAYCDCAPGYSGSKCENQYFICPSAGKFVDVFMYEQGKYFECTLLNGAYRLEQKSCAKGLRFNPSKNTCTY